MNPLLYRIMALALYYVALHSLRLHPTTSFPHLQLLERREALFKKSEARHARLEEAYRYHAFERDADETKSWINEKLKIAKDESYMDPTNLQVCSNILISC